MHLRQTRADTVRVLVHTQRVQVLDSLALMHPEWSMDKAAKASFVRADFQRRSKQSG
ncbi:hypothetical protein Dthio_PD3417 [Desulfonatronospira thiodismutans ASO3-1]|uniref:Uncharacterized protein n=1 Tax=Desulfonatronospira thiodismutans ASO3-1 TaxID=555779 RepID=D6SMR4_9BACT|nr:hypothetical protein [Desulfonatronospira thiodismutans]EFI35975.1 hypothetical protein Dthio_PD3417 [Desulfonatronospira thiodismutans ASO3-1]